MKITDIPVKMPTPFASSAGAGFITNPIPVPSQGTNSGRASFTDGFPPLTFTQLAAGGDPPWGADFNGLLLQITSWLRWAAAGGVPDKFDATFSIAIGGYPQGALIQSATFGHYWLSQVDDNPTNPNTGGANWLEFPDALIQIQGGNYASADTGAVNHVAVTLAPVPASLTSIVGAPIRFIIANANTITTPDININGLGAVTMINTDGSSIVVGQFSRTGQLCEGFLTSPTMFQVTSPTKTASAAGGLPPGAIILCPIEIPFAGTLECDGSLKNISDYPRLFNVIKANYGGDGINTFRVPDYRGTFPRGWDHGRGLDPNASTRTNRGDGTTGDHVGTNEADAVDAADLSGIINLSNLFVNIKTSAGLFGPVTTYNSTLTLTSGPFQYTSWPNVSGASVGFMDTGESNVLEGNVSGVNPDGNWLPPYPDNPRAIVNYISANYSVTGGGLETRPVNINAMYVIAF